ncbi:MAG: hypothetical protein EOM50_14670 [Erysipelotrichia bacterium]|nr:hypothetical protein [Erysipelotrichia bacterium]
MNINEKLENLYTQYWDELITNAKNTFAAHPLLLKVKKEYEDADIKIMIIGQETDGWHGPLEENNRSIRFLMDDYYHYLYDIYADKNDLTTRLNRKRKRAFWNKNNFRFFKEELTKRFPDQKLSFLWNNVSKIGKCSRGKPTDTILDLEENYFQGVFQKEIELLKPNVMVFVTGDRKIPIAHEKIKNIKNEQVSEIIFDRYPNIVAVRTYHPNAKIVGGKKHLKEQVIDLIVKKLRIN